MFALAAFTLAAQQSDLAPIDLNGMQVHPRNLLLKVDNPGTLHRLEHDLNLEVVKNIPEIGYVVVQAPEGMLQVTKSKARQAVGVQSVEFDRVAKLAYEPNDPLFPVQWSLAAMHLPEAWDVSRGDTPITVAVIDTGVNMTVPDLTANLWTNPSEIPDNGIDDDDNGYVDDVHGYDFAYNDSDPSDDYGHGTACSTIIASTQDNGIGMSGVAPMARIMNIKAAISSGYFYDSATVAAYIYAADNGAKIFSCSFYADSVSPAEQDAIRYAVSKGVLPIVAAANDNNVLPHYPAAYDECMSVAAVYNAPNYPKASFSDFGSWVDVSAPGVGVHVLWNGSYIAGNGTSFACPNVAGIAALLWSSKPSATADEIKAAIEDTATSSIEPPYGEVSNYGFVDAEKALNALLFAPAPRRDPAFRYMSPIGGTPPSSKWRMLNRIMGRGFEDGVKIVVKKGNRHLKVVDNGRDYIDFYNIPGDEPVDVFVDGNLVASVAQPLDPGYVYPMIEADASHATLTGGFMQTVNEDGNTMDCTAHGWGNVEFEGTFARVQPSSTMTLTFTRSYSGTVPEGSYEDVWLYDWSSWSWPYGNWITVNTEPVPTSPTTTQIVIPDAARFVDDDGYVYISVHAMGVSSDGAGHVDLLQLR